MGRREPDRRIENRVAAVRGEQGLSQEELGRRAGLTRQAVGAIEAGRHVPNTATSLRLASALACRVEDLFRVVDEEWTRPVRLSERAPDGPTRAVAVRTKRGWVAHPLALERGLQSGFAPGNALLHPGPGTARAEFWESESHVEETALVLGCDPALSVLARHLAKRKGELAWIPASSRRALDGIRDGTAHLAGSHLAEPGGPGFNVSQAGAALRGEGGVMVALASWEQGLVVSRGNPRAIREGADLARPDVTVVNREEGAGARQLLDQVLREAGVEPEEVRGYGRVVGSHMAVARAVAEGAAQVGVALRAAAELHGLGFVPLRAVRFDLVVPEWAREHPTVDAALDLLASGRFRRELGALPGYEVGSTGSVVAEIDPGET